MTFVHKIFCDQCDEEVADIFKHDCPESPENVAKRAVEDETWQDEFDRKQIVWHDWEDSLDESLDYATPPTMVNPHDVAIEGHCVVVSFAEWGDGIDYMSPELVSPTWAILTLVLEKAIHVTRDTHHCFLEGVEKTRWADLPSALKTKVKQGLDVYELSTGS